MFSISKKCELWDAPTSDRAVSFFGLCPWADFLERLSGPTDFDPLARGFQNCIYKVIPGAWNWVEAWYLDVCLGFAVDVEPQDKDIEGFW